MDNNNAKAAEIRMRYSTDAERDAAYSAAMEMAAWKDEQHSTDTAQFDHDVAELEKLLENVLTV